jgi:small subunit ribosomal protein S16
MLVIRFNRVGKKNLAYFRVVLQERTQAPGKRHVEILGSYDPHKKTSVLKKERILYWIGQGAQASPVVTNLLIREGVTSGKKIAKKMPRPASSELQRGEPAVKEEVKVEEASVAKSEEIKEEVKEEVKTEEVPIEEKEETKEETKVEETPVEAETKTEETPKA